MASLSLPPRLPPGVRVLVHDWLSANAVVTHDDAHDASVIDTGHAVRAGVTCAGVRGALCGRRLRRIVNTHLHSDHCGGNAALLREHGRDAPCRVLVPQGERSASDDADAARAEQLRGFTDCGQQAEPFGAAAGYADGDELRLAGLPWQVHAAGGHDDHALMLFQPDARVLISGDALWQHGFGVLFPELDGGDGFAAQRRTLERIEALRPALVIPGHGEVFADVDVALERAHARLQVFSADPQRHAWHAVRVLLRFHLLEHAGVRALAAMRSWFEATPLLQRAASRHWPQLRSGDVFARALDDLQRVGAVALRDGEVHDLPASAAPSAARGVRAG